MYLRGRRDQRKEVHEIHYLLRGEVNRLVLTQRTSQQLVRNLCSRKKILQLTTANGTSATSMNWEGEKEMETGRRRRDRERKEKESTWIHDKRIRDFLAPFLSLSPLVVLLPFSCGRRLRKFFYTCTRFISRGFPVWEHWMNSRDPRW